MDNSYWYNKHTGVDKLEFESELILMLILMLLMEGDYYGVADQVF